MKSMNDVKNFDESSFFYYEVIKLIDLENYDSAIKFIKNNIGIIKKQEDIALAYLNCGFMNDRLGNNISAIDDFSMSIYFEAELDILNQRSKDISFNGRSNSMYKKGDYKRAIEDKRTAKQIRISEIDQFSELHNIIIDYNNILLGTFLKLDLEPKFNTLIKVSKIEKSKYDLISDFKKVISKKKQIEVIKKLENLSDSKYKVGDYKGSIKAIRRAEKFY